MITPTQSQELEISAWQGIAFFGLMLTLVIGPLVWTILTVICIGVRVVLHKKFGMKHKYDKA